MPTWTKTKPPTWFPSAVATERGWENPVTSEILVSIGKLADASVPVIANVFVIKGTTVPSFNNPWTVEEKASSSFVTGNVMTLCVQFSSAVTASGPGAVVTIGSNDRTFVYSALKSTANTLVFTYTATSGDAATATHVKLKTVTGTITSTLTTGHPGATLTAPVSQPYMAVITVN